MVDALKAFDAKNDSTAEHLRKFGTPRAIWPTAARMLKGRSWHEGVLHGTEEFIVSWQKEEEEASRQRAIQ